MEENRKKPQVRFDGYTDDWEQRKLGDEAIEMVAGGDIDKSLLDEHGKYPVIANALTDDGIVGYYASDYRIKAPAVTVTGRGDVGHAKARTVDFTPVVRLLSVRSKHDVFFLENAINTLNVIVESTGVPQLTVPQLSQYEIFFPPTITEEKEIGAFFDRVDNLITLHQRKHNKLVDVKKSMLEKMFPKNGEKKPEIRFCGFTDDWEQRKVTELGKIYIGLVTTMTSHYTEHGALLIRNSDIKDSCFEFGTEPIYLDGDFAKQNASRQHKVGDVITVHTGDIGTSAVITEKEANSIGFATIVTRPYKDIITSDYLCTYLNTDTHKNFAMNISTGDGRNNYNLKDYYECVVPVPCIEEQKRISELIINLNNLITLHQREVEKLKNIKKSMLEKMFI